MKRLSYLLAILVLVGLALPAGHALADNKGSSEADRMLSAAAKLNYKGDAKGALALYTKAMNSKQLKGLKLAGAYNERGVILSGLGRKQDAIAEFTLAINLLPRQPYYYGNRARTYMTLKQPAKAAADFGKVIELVPSHPGSPISTAARPTPQPRCAPRRSPIARKRSNSSQSASRAKALLAELKKGG